MRIGREQLEPGAAGQIDPLAGPPSSTGSAASGAVRSSTTRVPSASRLATCTTIGRPARTPSSWPGTVAEVLTTSTSPALRCSPIRANRVCRMVWPSATSRRTPSRRSPRCSGGSVAVRSSGGANRVVGEVGKVDRHAAPAGTVRVAARSAAR